MVGNDVNYFLIEPCIIYANKNYLTYQVASFTGEKQAVEKYDKSLKSAYKSGVKEGLAAGLGMGTVMLLMFCGYSLGIWYGAKLILERGYTGAKVMNVIFAVLTGSL